MTFENFWRRIIGTKYGIMKKTIFNLVLFAFTLVGCDPPLESLEAIIKNTSDENLLILFDSEIDDFDMRLNIENNATQRLLSFTDIGSIGLSFRDYDSIYIENSSNEILKVYKADTPGKNIYDVDKYWQKREPSKNFFEYTYEITDEDIK